MFNNRYSTRQGVLIFSWRPCGAYGVDDTCMRACSCPRALSEIKRGTCDTIWCMCSPFSTAFPIYDDKAVEIGLRTFYELENWQTCVLFLHFFLCSYCDFAEILRRTSVYRYNSLETIYGMNVQNLDLLI